MGPPPDHDRALAVLREAVDLGITHIDTSNAYGPHVTNRLIREALHPYPEALHIGTKVGATRDQQGGRPPAREPEALRRAVQRSPNVLLIPGTSSPAHLRENIAGTGLSLSGQDLAELDEIGH